RLFRGDTNTSAGRYDYLNSSGYAEYGSIPAGQYLLRVDWLNQYFYTEFFTHDGSPVSVDIGGGELIILVKAGGSPLPGGVLTRLFRGDTNTSAGRYDYLNSSGYAEYGSIPAGQYLLRVDWLNQYFYTGVFTHNGSPVSVDIDGGKLDVFVTAGGSPLPGGVLTRLFRGDTNTSAGRYDYLNSSGYAEYGSIPAGQYLLRVDWLNQYFYTEIFTHDGSTQVLDLGGGLLNISITINGQALPSGVLTRLFRGDTNTSTGRYDYLNSSGYAEYGAIPEGTYLLRIDWMNRYYYTAVFHHDGQNSYDLTIAGEAQMDLEVVSQGSGLVGPNQLIYLYHVNSDGSLTYTGRYAYTDSSSHVIFSPVPAGTYKLKWNDRYSDSFTVTASAQITILL
ncbi:MAG: hypothetical protein ACFFD4_04420, partial [Candidatus Odinarchaeota archaeon]